MTTSAASSPGPGTGTGTNVTATTTVTATTPGASAVASQPNSAAAAPVTAAQARIAHLFRLARRRGQIHPLQHLIERYRAQQALADRPAQQP